MNNGSMYSNSMKDAWIKLRGKSLAYVENELQNKLQFISLIDWFYSIHVRFNEASTNKFSRII